MAIAQHSCPRCTRGMLFLEDDLYTRDLVCLQCGFRLGLAAKRRPVFSWNDADDEAA